VGNGTRNLYAPLGLAVLDAGATGPFVVVADTGNHRIVCYRIRDGQVMWTMGKGEPGSAPGEFHLPRSVAIVPQSWTGDEYWIAIADNGNRRVQVISLSGKVVRVYQVSRSPSPPQTSKCCSLGVASRLFSLSLLVLASRSSSPSPEHSPVDVCLSRFLFFTRVPECCWQGTTENGLGALSAALYGLTVSRTNGGEVMVTDTENQRVVAWRLDNGAARVVFTCPCRNITQTGAKAREGG
jgi:hypothetical protein